MRRNPDRNEILMSLVMGGNNLRGFPAAWMNSGQLLPLKANGR
jgi:hypothetical protein